MDSIIVDFFMNTAQEYVGYYVFFFYENNKPW